MAAVTNYCKLGGLKHQKFILSHPGGQKCEIKVFSGHSPCKGSGEKSILLPAPSAYPGIPISASVFTTPHLCINLIKIYVVILTIQDKHLVHDSSLHLFPYKAIFILLPY